MTDAPIHLGDFGTPKPATEEPPVFGYFGATLRVNPELTDLSLLDLFDEIAALSPDDPEANVRVGRVVRNIAAILVHADDLEQFWQLVKANRQGMEDMAALAMGVVSAITDRPTKLLPDSSDGQQTTEPSSTGTSSEAAQVIAELNAQGRPDLALMVHKRRESELSQASRAS